MAAAFDWPGWDRSGKSEEDALRALATYRPRYANVAALAGLADEFGAAGEFAVVERQAGIATAPDRTRSAGQLRGTGARRDRQQGYVWTYLNGRGERSSGHAFQLSYMIAPAAGLLVEVA